MVAESLLHSSGICVVLDTFQTNASVLFHHYLKSWSGSQPYIVVFALANPPETIANSLSAAKNAVIVDCFSDSNGWNNKEENVVKVEGTNCQILSCSDLYSLSNLEKSFSKAVHMMKCDKNSKKVSIMIDSLGVLMLQHSAGNMRQFLQRLYEECEPKQSRVVSILHTDAMLRQDLSQIEYGVHTVVQVQLPLATLETIPGQPKTCAFLSQSSTLRSQRLLVIRHDRPSGRVAWATEGYGIDQDGNLVSMKVPKSTPVQVETDSSGNNLDPTANLTFNLKLTEQEQAAKDKLILPYMHHLDSSIQDPSKSGSIIYYESDDDYDEEDPDDDLDI